MYRRYRRAIERLYTDTCNIYEYGKHKDLETEETIVGLNPKPTHENVPCKLSKKTISPTSQTDLANTIQYSPILFINPEIEIKPGSKIAVSQHGVTREFKQSGEPFVYETHQEIMLQRTGKA